MKIRSLTAAAAVAATLLCALTSAQAVEVKGQVSMPYNGTFFGFSDKPSDSDKLKAVQQAKIAAIKKYSTSFSLSEQRLFAQIEGEVLSNPDRYVSNYRVVSERLNPDLKTFDLVARVNINDSLLMADMHRNAPVSSTPAGDGSLFASLFVAREVSESKIYDERRTSISQKKTAADASRSASAGTVSETASRTEQTSTGGNTIRKSAVNKYRALGTTDFNSAFNQALTQLGFESTEYADVFENCGGARPDALKAAFMKGDELPSNLRNQAIKASKKCDVRYFATGYLNVTAPHRDSVSGRIQVNVSVNGMVWDISKRLPRKVGSVGPVQAFGLADDQDSARREALRQAALQAGQAIGSQLTSKSIR